PGRSPTPRICAALIESPLNRRFERHVLANSTSKVPKQILPPASTAAYESQSSHKSERNSPLFHSERTSLPFSYLGLQQNLCARLPYNCSSDPPCYVCVHEIEAARESTCYQT